MFLNCNEEIKRHKEQTIRSQNMLISKVRGLVLSQLRGTLVGVCLLLGE